MQNWKKIASHASISLGITAAVVAVVILLNVLLGFLFSSNLLYLDMTAESRYKVYSTGSTKTKSTTMYRLTDEAVDYLGDILEKVDEQREEPVSIDIIFCADPDLLVNSSMMRYVYYTALNLEKEFSENIHVKTVDVLKNPSAVDAYRTNSYSNIYQSHIIIASGTEFRVNSIKSFYTYDTDSTSDPWAYNGEKTFIKQIIAVTRAESPIACLTTNHGEPFANLDLSNVDNWTEYNEFIYVLQNAGYDVQYIDLEKDEIPENCRLIITYDPQTDFKSKFDDDTVVESETIKLDKFLDNAYSYIVFVDPDTPVLQNMETYLEKWGIIIDRGTNTLSEQGSYMVIDSSEDVAIKTDGTVFSGTYSQAGLGYSVVSDMLSNGTPKVAFGNTVSIKYAYQTYYVLEDEDNGTAAYSYGSYYKNGISRNMYTMFYSSSSANAYLKVNGNMTSTGKSGQFNLITITSEDRTVSEGQGYTSVNEASYVCAVGSTDFVRNAYLSGTTYGNTDVMLSTLRNVGREITPVGIAFISLYSDEIGTDYLTETAKVTTTVLLVTIPAVLLIATGVVVMVRRKTKH